MSDVRERELWRQAVQGDGDAMEALKAAWLRTLTSCPRCMTVIVEGQEHDCAVPPASVRKGGSGGSLPITTIPRVPLAQRPYKEPLYDLCRVTSSDRHVDFFKNTGGKPIWESNFPGNEGGLRPGSMFYFYGLSMVPDATADPRDLIILRDRSAVSMHSADRTIFTHPSRIALDDQPLVETQAGEEVELQEIWRAGPGENNAFGDSLRMTRLRHDGPIRDVRITGKPIMIEPRRPFRIRLEGDFSGMRETVGVMAVMFGIGMREITG